MIAKAGVILLCLAMAAFFIWFAFVNQPMMS